MSKFLLKNRILWNRWWSSLLLLLLVPFSLSDCASEAPAEPLEYQQATAFTVAWNHLLLDLERYTPGYRAPISARMFAYVELVGYEAAWPALRNYAPATSFCPGYPGIDSHVIPADYCLPAGLNAAYARTCRDFFPNAPEEYLHKISQLEEKQLQILQHKTLLPAESLRRSIAYGQQVAEAVWQWSATDMTGHHGFLYNYDQHYTPPQGPGLWQPNDEHAMPALAPNWGDARTFAAHISQIAVRPPIAFSEAPGSSFYTDALEVFSMSQSLSKENHWIAEFWSDDLPGLTMSPSGRWISITSQVILQVQPTFPEIIATYLKVGLALCDASIICWHGKYQYNVERPQSYIRRVVQRGWSPLHDSPPFPSYPSGHAVFGEAVAEVLTATFGDDFSFTDHTHESRREFAGLPRHFRSFEEMARENAFSRVAIGVHYRMDCEEGLRLGKIIGQQIANLPLRRATAAALER